MNTNAWTSEQIVFDAKEYFDRVQQDIRNARKSIWIESYIFNLDQTGRRILDSLKDKAKLGLDIRITVDGFGSRSWWNRSLQEELDEIGIKAGIYNPLPLSDAKSTLRKKRASVWERFRKVNLRNHRKIILIDDEVLWTGSLNITDDHLSNWNDAAVRLEGQDVKIVRHTIATLWGERPSNQSSTQVLLNDTFLKRRHKKKLLIQKIIQAKERIWMTTPYFVPPQALLRAIKIASRRGIDVQLLLPGRSDVPFVKWVSTVYFKGILKSGAKIFELKHETLHTKSTLIDQWVLLGSSNLNHRSFQSDLELDVCLGSQSSRTSLENHFQQGIDNSVEVTLESLSSRLWLRELIGRLLWWIKPWS